MKRALHLVTSLDPGGIERWLVDLIEPLDVLGWKTDFVCKSVEGVWAADARASGSSVTVVPFGPSHIPYMRATAHLIRDGRYSVVHNHLETYSGVGTWTGRAAGVPVITMFHNTSFGSQSISHLPLKQLRAAYGAASIRYAVARSDLVTGCAEAVLDVVPLVGRTPRRVVRYGAPDRPRPRKDDLFERPEGAVVVSHIGRFAPQKNHIGLLEAFEIAHGTDPRLFLVLVGDGPEMPAVRERLANLGCRNAVALLGQRENGPDYIASSDIVFMPSHHEGFPLTAIEAAAAGVPLVGSDIPGLNEAVIDGVTGFLRRPGDAGAMAACLIDLAAHADLRRSLGEAARSHFLESLSIAASAESVAAAYREVARY